MHALQLSLQSCGHHHCCFSKYISVSLSIKSVSLNFNSISWTNPRFYICRLSLLPLEVSIWPQISRFNTGLTINPFRSLFKLNFSPVGIILVTAVPQSMYWRIIRFNSKEKLQQMMEGSHENDIFHAASHLVFGDVPERLDTPAPDHSANLLVSQTEPWWTCGI